MTGAVQFSEKFEAGASDLMSKLTATCLSTLRSLQHSFLAL
jgi:hypothetical protein